MKEIISQIIKDRHSTWPANFDPVRKIDNALIADILDIAVWAPSHGLTQPWRFIVFHDLGIRKFFAKQQEIYLETTPPEQVKESKIKKLEDKIRQVSHVVAICMIRDSNRKYPEIEEVVATSCVIENIYLSLNAFGIAGYLSTGDICYTRQMHDFLNLGPEDRCLGFFMLGFPGNELKTPLRKRIPAAEKTMWINA
jgi:nitroreductase